MKRIVLDTMRQAGRPVTSADVATKVMAARMLPATDPELRKLMVRRVGQCLFTMQRKGLVRTVEPPGRLQVGVDVNVRRRGERVPRPVSGDPFCSPGAVACGSR